MPKVWASQVAARAKGIGMIPGSIPAIARHQAEYLRKEGCILGTNILERSLEYASNPPVRKCPNPPGWKKSMRGLAWDEACQARAPGDSRNAGGPASEEREPRGRVHGVSPADMGAGE